MELDKFEDISFLLFGRYFLIKKMLQELALLQHMCMVYCF